MDDLSEKFALGFYGGPWPRGRFGAELLDTLPPTACQREVGAIHNFLVRIAQKFVIRIASTAMELVLPGRLFGKQHKHLLFGVSACPSEAPSIRE